MMTRLLITNSVVDYRDFNVLASKTWVQTTTYEKTLEREDTTDITTITVHFSLWDIRNRYKFVRKVMVSFGYDIETVYSQNHPLMTKFVTICNAKGCSRKSFTMLDQR